MELRLGEKFKLIKKIGSGAFGEIYKGNYKKKIRGNPFPNTKILNNLFLGTNTQTGEDVAVKLVIYISFD